MSSIPGFTAEASLGRGETRFAGETSAAVRGAGEVVAHAITAQFAHRPPVDCDFLECDLSASGSLRCHCG